MSDKIKIVYIDFDDVRNPLLGGGQAIATNQVGKRLVEKGYKVTSLCAKYPGYKDRIEDGIFYKHIGINTNSIKLNNLAYLFAAPFSAGRERADIILECFTAPVSTLFTPLFTKIPVIGIPSMFNAKEFVEKYGLPFHLVEALGIKFYKYLLPYSEIDSSKAKRLNSRIDYRIVPQGVDKSFFSIKSKKGKYILFLGRFDISQKGIDLLLNSYAIVKNKIKYPLVLAGHGPDEKKIIELIKSLKLEDKVTISGPSYGNKKIELIKNAISVAFPSRHDEMSLWALEALAAGLPIVAFDLPESKWMKKSVSIKAKCFDTDEYAKKLILSTKPEVNKKMRKSARIFARQFSWENVASEYSNYFKYVLEKEGKINDYN